MPNAFGCIATFATALAFIAGCGGAGPASSSAGAACVSGAVPRLLYPTDGASGVASGSLTIGLGFTSGTNTVSTPSVTPTTGGMSISGGPYLSPSPGPSNPPGFDTLRPGEQYYQSTFGPLSPTTTYTVVVTDTKCAKANNIGTFTTR